MAYSALSAAEIAENKRALATGLTPPNQGSLTAVTGGTLDTTWGAPELAELQNVIARQAELEAILKEIGWLAT